MTTISPLDPKSMSKRLRADLAARGIEMTHSDALEIVAHQHGHKDWNTMAALEAAASDAVEHRRAAIPILRMFDVERTLAFYVDFLGFSVTWQHRFAEHAPLYLQVERDGIRLHLSEHHGDATPGSAVIIEITDAVAMQRELLARDYPYARPGVETQDWGLTVTVGDPAGNRVIFLEPRAEAADPAPGQGSPLDTAGPVSTAGPLDTAGPVSTAGPVDPMMT